MIYLTTNKGSSLQFDEITTVLKYIDLYMIYVESNKITQFVEEMLI